MQREISSSEFTEWQAFYRLEPFGDLVADQRHGVATSTFANANRNPATRPEVYRPEDFIHWYSDGSVVDSDDDGEFIDDPVALSNLIRAQVFRLPPRT